MIRSWRHAADCAQCNEHLTTSVSLEKVRARDRQLSGTAAAAAAEWYAVQ